MVKSEEGWVDFFAGGQRKKKVALKNGSLKPLKAPSTKSIWPDQVNHLPENVFDIVERPYLGGGLI